ncbi:MAG: Rrf2 family transcriptional regulator [Prolixibacteraceae bacterium]
MKFSTKTRYGIRAMLDVAANESQGGVFQKDIAERQHISIKYLDQIIYALKTAGLIINTKGKKSGYKLSRKPSEITVLDVHNAFEHGICIIDCMSPSFTCEMKDTCMIQGFWGKLNSMISDYLKNATLQDIINRKELMECAADPERPKCTT